MESPPIYRLPQDILCMIFIKLPLRQIIICNSISKLFHHLLTSPHFLHLISNHHIPLVAVRPPLHDKYYRPVPPPPVSILQAFDPTSNQWLKFDLTFLPFTSLFLVTSSHGCVYLWGESPDSPSRSLVVCNPLTRAYRVLPRLESSWSKHGSVLPSLDGRVLLFNQLTTLYWCDNSKNWLRIFTNLRGASNMINCSPKSSVFIGNSVYALCTRHIHTSLYDIVTCYKLPENESLVWSLVKKKEWGDGFDRLQSPKLLRGVGNKILIVGAEQPTITMLINDYNHLAILILRLDLDSLEWDEAGRMPLEMYKCFEKTILRNKYFGGGDRVYISTPEGPGGKLVVWDDSAGGGGEWRWIEGAPDYGDGLPRGFVFDACFGATP